MSPIELKYRLTAIMLYYCNIITMRRYLRDIGIRELRTFPKYIVCVCYIHIII